MKNNKGIVRMPLKSWSVLSVLAVTLSVCAPLSAGEDTAAFEALCQKVQQGGAASSEEDLKNVFKQARELGRPYSAHLAVKPYFEQNLNPGAALVLAAAENAFLAGDYRTSVGRYKTYLKNAPVNAESSAAAGRMYVVQIDFLNAADDAYQFMKQAGTKYRDDAMARKFDSWFVEEARNRKDFASLAERLAIVFADKMPLEQERLYFWNYLDWMLEEVGRVQPEHYPAAAPLRALAPLIRDTPRYAARVNLYATLLGYYAGNFHQNKERMAPEFEAVNAAAKAYVDTGAALPVYQDLLTLFVGGKDRWDDGMFQTPPEARRKLLLYCYEKLNDDDKKQALAWNPHGRWALQYTATAAEWIELVKKKPEIYSPFARSLMPMLEGEKAPLDHYKKQAEVLDNVASRAAAVSRALAASDTISATMRHLAQKESWYLQGADYNDILRNRVWNAFRQFERPQDKQINDQHFHDSLAEVGVETFLQTPVALFDPNTARDTLWNIWHAKDARTKFVPYIQALAWIPYTDAERKHAFGQVYEQVKQWAEHVRKQKNDPNAKASMDVITALDKALSDAMDSKSFDAAKNPNPVFQKLALAVQAARGANRDAFLQNAKDLYAYARDYEAKKTPFGSQILRWVCTTQPFDTLDFQLEALKDQLAILDVNGTHRQLMDVCDGIVTNRKGWQRNAWNWWTIPSSGKATAKSVNDVLAAGILKLAEKDQFSPHLFSLFRATRRGNNWQDQGANGEVLAKLIEKKLFYKAPYIPEWWVRSNAASYQWMISREFQGLAKQWPHEKAFDDMYVEELKQTKLLDSAYWQFGRDENRKIVNAAAPILAEMEKVPFGYDPGQRAYDRNDFFEWHRRAIAADAPVRDAFLQKLESYYGKSRFDGYAMGGAYFSTLASTEKPDARKQFFGKLREYLDRVKTHPARVGPPYLEALSKIADVKTVTDDELVVLLNTFPVNVPTRWAQNNHNETLAALLHAALAGRDRSNDLYAVVPHFWKIARDTGNATFQRQLATFAKALSDEGKHELATVYINAGLEIAGSTMAEDVQSMLRAARAKSMINVGSVNPFKRSDPRYNIGNAQAEYLSGKLQSAWEMYLPGKAILRDNFKELDPNFVLWIIEKNTETRNFEEAENLARVMMQYFEATPGGFEAETRARLFYNYASIAFERQEYPRARAHYERIAETKEYEGTRAKREAELRIAEVDRRTKSFDRAILQLEKLSRRKDDFLQTEAYYQLALVKFDQEDWTEAQRYLEQVLSRNRNHAMGKILEGKLALQTKRYETATDLAIGQASTQEILVPGRPLKVTLDDKNLSVVGQAVQIEIRAWTDSGDEETFMLLPAGDSKTTFEGRLPTALGKIEKNDKTLQVFGKDRIHYNFSEAFKKNYKIVDSHPGTMLVASNAELYVSSGKILSKEEMEERALEKMVRERLRVESGVIEGSKEALSKLREDDQIKPGNPINVRIVDVDRNLTPEPDSITVNVASTSGDRIVGLPLKETGPTTGIFEGAIQTASAQAMAFASDSEEGRDPNSVITSEDRPYWSALPDSVRPKSFSIDLNDNLPLGKLHIDANVPGRKLKAFLLQTSLNGRDFQTIGQYPEEFKPWDGSLELSVMRFAHGDNGLQTLQQYQNYCEVGWLKDKQPRISLPPALAFKFDHDLNGKGGPLHFEHDGKNSHYVLHLRGSFYLNERQTRTFKLETSGRDKKRFRVMLAIDGQQGQKPDELQRSLMKGVHRLDVYVLAWRHSHPNIKLLCDTDQPPFIGPCPPEMFDITKQPEISKAILFEAAKVQASNDGGTFDITPGKDTRARALRLMITDYETDAPAIQKITLQDPEGKKILPTKEDVAALRKNQKLEIVPGDRVTIAYEDPVVVTKGKEHNESFLTATFYNAKLSACFVDYIKRGENREAEYIPMRRFKAGDKINVFISDPDMDVTEKPDVITFSAKTPNGEPVLFKALETEPHSGIFIGNIFPVPGKPARDVEMTVAAGDDIIVSYRDAENTDPGVPWDRTYVVEQSADKTPDLRIYAVTSKDITPEEQEAWLKQRKQETLGVEELIPAAKDLIAAVPPTPLPDGTPIHAFGPLVFELRHPALAQSKRSTATVYVQTGSARKKAGKSDKDPYDINVPGTLKIIRTPKDLPTLPVPVGYRSMLVRGDRSSIDPLESGRFLFYVPLKLGTQPEKSLIDIEQLAHNESDLDQTPLTIWGSDDVFVGFEYDEAGQKKWVVQKAILSSDCMFHIMDRRYQEERSGAYIGETIYFRVVHPESDTSDQKDMIDLALTSSSGKQATIKLSEATTHSGIFKGFVRLVYSGDKVDKPDPDAFQVNYGDQLTAEFKHAKLPEGVKRSLQVFKGADGKVVTLTKRFKDPTIAVQTQLTLAEAYFEQAKRHRDLGQRDLSAKEIAQGKNILEEAQRDYPNAEARAQVDYLLANLALEFAGDAPDEESAKKYHVEAITRFTDYVRNYPDSTYAPKAQYKKALTLEKMGQMDQACEEYVKLSYRYPDNELVAETIARLGQYFWNKGKTMLKEADSQQVLVESEKIRVKAREMYKTAGQVFGRLAARFPQHALAGKTRVISAQCFIHAGDIPKAIEIFTTAMKDPNLDKDLIAESMYWCADCYAKQNDFLNAYRGFIKLTWDYPASKWAKFARSKLAEDQYAKMSVDQIEQK
ncbi:MAG TPA: tetratricopeptide repeat protein [Planctomycetota bacterium]|nr:tetratricopeptide repeat protein [Planctomycetota bacterium]